MKLYLMADRLMVFTILKLDLFRIISSQGLKPLPYLCYSFQVEVFETFYTFLNETEITSLFFIP